MDAPELLATVALALAEPASWKVTTVLVVTLTASGVSDVLALVLALDAGAEAIEAASELTLVATGATALGA